MVAHDLSNRYEGLASAREWLPWALNAASTDVALLGAFLSDAVDLLRQCTSSAVRDTIGGYDGFKLRLREKGYPNSGDLLAPISGAIQKFLDNPDPDSFFPVYQVLSFLTHVSLKDLDNGQDLEDEYIAREIALKSHKVPAFLIDEMNSIMKEWMRGFELSDRFIPKHGPGSVAMLKDKSLQSKYEDLTSDSLLDYVFYKHAGFYPQSFFPLEYSPKRLVRQSEMVLVAKSLKTMRTISKEPATLQYFQQGVREEIQRWVSEHPYLSKRIDFSDQQKQRELALEASRTRQFATVDLSAASDTVQYDLVKRIFSGTALLPYLVALRSRSTVLPSGKVVELTKFAPMGSALTFPIETLIFACIAECTVRYVAATTGEYDSQYRVYGDDIIIPDRCLTDLEHLLRFAGFSVNTSKTYGGDYRFRESCGLDAYDGVDVSPLRISRNFSAERVHARTPGVFAGRCEFANSANEYGYATLRRYLIRSLLDESRYLPLFSEDGSKGVFSTQPSNFHLPRRKFGDYQREEVRAASVSTYTSKTSPSIRWDFSRKCYAEADGGRERDDRIRLFEWYRRTVYRTGDPHDPDHRVLVTTGSAGTYLSRRWVPLPNE